MKFTTSWLWPVLICSASAAQDATVYLFDEARQPSDTPVLTPAEARLIFAQRLGVSQYHGLEGVNEKTISHINHFGGPQAPLFDSMQDKPAGLLLVIEGLQLGAAEWHESAWAHIAFSIAKPPSTKDNQKLFSDLNLQLGAGSRACSFEEDINPFDDRCWNGKSKVIHIDMQKGGKDTPTIDDVKVATERLLKFSQKDEMNTMIVFLPKLSSSSRSSSYGTYEMPSQNIINRRAETEEPITQLKTASSSFSTDDVFISNTSSELVRGVIPTCFSSLASCISGTNNCSSHGQCMKKFPSRAETDLSPTCFTCICGNTTDIADDGSAIFTSWGGAACQKRDISGPFWLIVVSSVVLVGLVAWAIRMLFSIGEEKLPGVIGAGVSSKSR